MTQIERAINKALDDVLDVCPELKDQETALRELIADASIRLEGVLDDLANSVGVRTYVIDGTSVPIELLP